MIGVGMFWVEKMIIEIKENKYPVFPQANDIYRVIAYVSTFFNENNAYDFNFLKDNITQRQIQYYKSAAEYLGLINKNKPTESARVIFSLKKKDLLINVMKIILGNRCFYDYFKERDNEKAITFLMERYSFSYVTANRRLSTIRAWCAWCLIISEENKITIK